MFLRANYPTITNGFRGVFVFSAGLKVEKYRKRRNGQKVLYTMYITKFSLKKVSQSCWKYRKHSYLCCRKQYETTIKQV